MAPSQHLRPTLGVLLLGATLALSACGTQQPGAAAIVDGKAISDKDVQAVALQLDTIGQDQQKFSPSIVLLNLILAPYVIAEGARAGKSVTDAQARKVVAKIDKPSPETIDFVRMQMVIPSLTPAGKATVLDKISKSDITVSPRYGTFNAQQGLVATAPNWIKPTAAPGAK